MHVEEVAHAVAGAVQVAQAVLPQVLACERVELCSACAFREYGLCKGYVPFHHQREVGAFLLGGGYSSKMRDLLRLIAFQLGSEVSYEELGKQLGMSKTTVEKYLDLLEKVFVIYRLGAYSRNLRKEVTKAGKWYFYDNGIRNAIIGAFSPLAIRQDVGALWENYIIGERRKANFNEGLHREFYFWRTYDKQEIDLIEESADSLTALEFKWGNKMPAAPKAFQEAYPYAEFHVVNRENYLEFV